MSKKYRRTSLAVWEITLKCNLACSHCGSRAGKARADELSPQEALDLVRQFAEVGIKEVTLIGGEAFLRPDWLDIARAITEAGMLCSMTTGGYGISLETAHRMKQAGIANVSVSTDGLEATHDRLRGRKGSWKSGLQTMRHFKEVGIQFGCNTQINRLSAPEFPLIYEHIRIVGKSGLFERDFKPPPGKPMLSELTPTQVVEIVSQEYSALRGEIQTALASQASILSFGAAAVGLLLAAGARLWNDEKLGAGLLYLLGVPATCLMSVVLFLGEQIRLTRAGLYLYAIEKCVNRADPVGTDVLAWETWGYERQNSGDLEQRTRWVVGAVFALLALGSAVFGYEHVHREDASLAVASLLAALVGAIGGILWTRRLAGCVRDYREYYRVISEDRDRADGADHAAHAAPAR